MSVGGVEQREERPGTITFRLVPVEDKQASLKAGHYVANDVEYVDCRIPFSVDSVTMKVPFFFSEKEREVREGRFRAEWLEAYRKIYAAWKKGLELPPDGTPIRGWPVISPAQQQNLIAINVLTVEDLAGINDEGMSRLRMGGLDLKNKAKAWLAQRNDKAPLTMEIASLKQDNENMRADLKVALAKIEQLSRLVPAPAAVGKAPQPTITANDILGDGDDDDSLQE